MKWDDKMVGICALALLGSVYIVVSGLGGKVPTEVVTNVIVAVAGLVTGKALSTK